MNETPDDARTDEACRNYLAQSWWPPPPAHRQQSAGPSDNPPLQQPNESQPPLSTASEKLPSWTEFRVP